MSLSYKYAIARLLANPARGEQLNLAIVVFDTDRLLVHTAKNLEKIRAISAALNRDVVEQTLENLKVFDRGVRDDGATTVDARLAALSRLSPVGFSDIGQFYAKDADAYSASVEKLLYRLVEPEPAPPRPQIARKTPLLSSIKAAFRLEKILARKGEKLDSHRVVLNERLAEGLNADMLLKNGAMHVVQTVDASHSDRARRAIQEIGISALVFEQARIQFGTNATNPRLVYTANGQMEHAITPALLAAEHQGAHLINWASRDDRVRFIVDMSSLAEPTDAQAKASFGAINASSTRRFKLN